MGSIKDGRELAKSLRQEIKQEVRALVRAAAADATRLALRGLGPSTFHFSYTHAHATD